MINFTHNPKYKRTPSDELFYKLFGCYPKKAGTAFELIATSAMWCLAEKDHTASVFLGEEIINSKHDEKVKDVATHQIDGIIECRNKKGKIISQIVLEAKDHHQNKKGKNVAIGEVQKLESTMRDIEYFDSGVFFTSTDYSSESIKFAKGLSPKKHQKKIKLFKSRPSIKEDELNRIKKILLNLTTCIPHYFIYPYITRNAVLFPPIVSEYFAPLYIYDEHQKKVCINHILTEQYGELHKETKGFVHMNGYIEIYEDLIPIIGFSFQRVDEVITETREIGPNGNPMLYVKSITDGNVDTLITDTDLKDKIKQLLYEKNIDIEHIKIV